jgi:ribonuclease III
MRAELESLEEILGHRFTDRELLSRALTHSSVPQDQVLTGEGAPVKDNEQLEFLGDAVLGFIVSELLLARYPEYPEGRLSQVKSYLVSSSWLFQVAELLNLAEYLQLGRNFGGRSSSRVVANTVEAVIAALYLDAGIDVARTFISRWIVEPARLDDEQMPERLPGQIFDFKTALQELALIRKLPMPRYVVIDERGPDHAKLFVLEVRVGSGYTARAEGHSKKSAAKKAARAAYERILRDEPAS